mgnify:FL=1
MNINYPEVIQSLNIWSGEIDIQVLGGGITNHNFVVIDNNKKAVVRIGQDIPEHLVIRSNELMASQAANKVGIGPKILHHEKGILVLDFIESKTYDPELVRNNIHKIIPLIKKVHQEIPNHLIGAPMIFWVFHVIKNYANFLEYKKSKHILRIPELLKSCKYLEKLSAPHEIVYGHNDLLAANFLDDGSKLWLVDWEYAGFNNPLFDLGGLASNNDFSSQQEISLLEEYFEKKITDKLLEQYHAMKCSSLLRETMWSMVSEISSSLDFDYQQYTEDYYLKYKESYENLTK